MSETSCAEPGSLTDSQLDWMKHDVGGTHLMYAAAYEIEKLRSSLAALKKRDGLILVKCASCEARKEG